MGETSKTFNKRKVISLILLVALIMMPVSAIVAHATHWTAAHHTWLHIHGLFGVLFVVAGIFHVIYNWRALKHYLVGKS